MIYMLYIRDIIGEELKERTAMNLDEKRKHRGIMLITRGEGLLN